MTETYSHIYILVPVWSSEYIKLKITTTNSSYGYIFFWEHNSTRVMIQYLRNYLFFLKDILQIENICQHIGNIYHSHIKRSDNQNSEDLSVKHLNTRLPGAVPQLLFYSKKFYVEVVFHVPKNWRRLWLTNNWGCLFKKN